MEYKNGMEQENLSYSNDIAPLFIINADRTRRETDTFPSSEHANYQFTTFLKIPLICCMKCFSFQAWFNHYKYYFMLCFYMQGDLGADRIWHFSNWYVWKKSF